MATGVVSIASALLGMQPIAWALLIINWIAYPSLWGLTLVRVVAFRRQLAVDISDHQRAPGFFTLVAGTCVFGTQNMPNRHRSRDRVEGHQRIEAICELDAVGTDVLDRRCAELSGDAGEVFKSPNPCSTVQATKSCHSSPASASTRIASRCSATMRWPPSTRTSKPYASASSNNAGSTAGSVITVPKRERADSPSVLWVRRSESWIRRNVPTLRPDADDVMPRIIAPFERYGRSGEPSCLCGAPTIK